MTGGERVTYRSVLANREFAALLSSTTLSVVGDQLARIAIAVLIYERTGSPFLGSATFALSYLTYLLGGPLLSVVSDRSPRVTVMVVCDVARAPLVLLLCFSQVPTWAVFTVLTLVGLLAPPFDSARGGLQPDVLDGERYVMGNALMNLVAQTGQVVGFVVGGALVSAVSVQGALALDAATFLVSAGIVLAGVRPRAAAIEAADRRSMLSDTRAGMSVVLAHPELRRLLGFALLGSAAVIAPEGLAVPVADTLREGPLAAGILTASVPAGFVIGSFAVLRLTVERRRELLPALALIGCVPLLFTPLATSVPMVCLLWFIAGIGGSLNIIASSAYIAACPREYRSRAHGVAVTALYSVQGLSLLLAGWISGPVGPRAGVAIVAALTLAALLVTLGRSSGSEVVPQGQPDLVRSSRG